MKTLLTLIRSAVRPKQPETMHREVVALITLAGRRCAYDLKHAAGDIKDPHFRKLYAERAAMWLEIFDPADGPKKYRHELHETIARLQYEKTKLIELCEANGVNLPRDIDAIPF